MYNLSQYYDLIHSILYRIQCSKSQNMRQILIYLDSKLRRSEYPEIFYLIQLSNACHFFTIDSVGYGVPSGILNYG